MKKVAIIIGILILFLFQCQSLNVVIGLLNQPDTLLANIGLVLMGIEIFIFSLLFNYSHGIVMKWYEESKQEKKAEKKEVEIVEPPVKKKKRTYYKPKKKSEFPIKSTEKTEKK
jgi:hypothetical protein